MPDELRSGLRMLKRTWSSGESGPPKNEASPAPPRTLSEHNAPLSAAVPESMADFEPFVESPPPWKENRAPTAKRTKTSSDSSLFDLVGPPVKDLSRTLSTGPAAPVAPEHRATAKVFLSPEQQRILDAVVTQGRNVFFTGSAGAGKSHLLRQIIQDLRRKFQSKSDAVAVTASTGIAACNIGGITLHSFGGVGLAKESPERLLTYIRRNRGAVTRWMRTQVLIIDEVSMLESKLFEKLEAIARMIRKSTKPFGGMQIVMTGDFFQLPPVSVQGDAHFVFESPKWSEVIQDQFNLTQVFRQKDHRFVGMLNEMRLGKLSPDTVRAFSQLDRVPALPDGITPTELYPLRRDVERANKQRLDALDTEARTYTSLDGGSLPPDQRERVLDNFMAPRQVFLKKGAQVMLIKNLDSTLANGSIGTVLDFMDESTFQNTYGDDADLLRTDVAETLLARAERARGATRTSRSPEKDQPRSAQWPLVRFHLGRGKVRDQLVRPETWKNEDPHGDVVACRTQVPLLLAWASTYALLTQCRSTNRASLLLTPDKVKRCRTVVLICAASLRKVCRAILPQARPTWRSRAPHRSTRCRLSDSSRPRSWRTPR